MASGVGRDRALPFPVEEDSNLVEVFRAQAVSQPEALAYRLLSYDAEGVEERVDRTFAEIDRQARAVAVRLGEVAAVGDRAIVMCEPGLEYVAAFVGCLYAGVVAVPLYPPDPFRVNRTLSRLRSVIADAQARVVLTHTSLLGSAETLLRQAAEVELVLAVDQIEASLGESWREPSLAAADLAFLQYTSGSTGTPKGVMVSHGNLLFDMAQIVSMVDDESVDVTASWLPPYHDMGLIGGVLLPWHSGRTNLLMSPLAFYRRPWCWLQAISRYGVKTAGAPNFAYDLCVRKTTKKERAGLDLSRWSLALNGAEPVRAATIERFVEAFGPCGVRREIFYPCYGLAEATLMVSGGLREAPPVIKSFDAVALEEGRAVELDEGATAGLSGRADEQGESATAGLPSSAADDRATDHGATLRSGPATQRSDPSPPRSAGGESRHHPAASRVLVGCGHAVPEETIAIVDPKTHRALPPGEVGEIWVAGPHVAGGYWNREEESRQAFEAHTAAGEGPFLRTGDLGFFDRGELFVTGRLKDLLIVEGKNHYPEEIEHSIEGCHEAVKPYATAVFAVEAGEREEVVLVQEVLRPKRWDLNQVIHAIRRRVRAEHQIPLDAVVLISQGSIPKTSSGKIQRHACRELYQKGELSTLARWHAERLLPLHSGGTKTYTPPRNQTESWLCGLWGEVLGIEQVGIHDDFFDLGGNSLLATQLISRLAPGIEGELPLEEIFGQPTVAALAELLDRTTLESADEASLADLLETLEKLPEQEAATMLEKHQTSNGNGHSSHGGNGHTRGNGHHRDAGEHGHGPAPRLQIGMAAGPTGELEYLVIGAGPAGLQLGYFLEQAGRNYQILEGGKTPGGFFQKYPRHRTLLSINKVHTGYDDPETNLRWDWNSLLCGHDEKMQFRQYSQDYLPGADDLVRYLADYAQYFGLNVQYQTHVKQIYKEEDGRFRVEDSDGRQYRAKVLVVATGCAKPYVPDIPGIELAENYTHVSVDPQDFAGQRVLILGKGNSAFETADNLLATTSLIHLASPSPVQMAWKTHFVGHLRAVNNNVLDTYLLKSQNALLDGEVVRIERRGEKLVATVSYTHACDEEEELVYDRIIACTGFRFDGSIFDDSCRPELTINERFPDQTAEWESTNVRNLYFAGTLMQTRDFKKKQSAFIHGFRYNIDLLYRIFEEKYHEREIPWRPVVPEADALVGELIERINTNSALWQQTGFMCDVVVIDGENSRYYDDLTLDYAHQSWLGECEHYYTVTMEFGQERIDAAPDVFAVPRIHKDDANRAEQSTGIHPIVRRFCRGRLVSEHHVIEDLASEFHEEVHAQPMREYFSQQLKHPAPTAPAPRNPRR